MLKSHGFSFHHVSMLIIWSMHLRQIAGKHLWEEDNIKSKRNLNTESKVKYSSSETIHIQTLERLCIFQGILTRHEFDSIISSNTKCKPNCKLTQI